ncbi:hypothetical protein C7293_31475 [filamentous cyanobacterium CCT1]|nr:hypothetical protein C7293_31475 [filamentous cyanobacterium CCT1]
MARLKAQDIQVRLRQQDHTFSGISFETDGIAFAGYQLGPSFSLGGLQRHRQVYYESDTHDEALRQLLDAAPDACRQHLKDHDKAQHQLRHRYQLYADAGEGMQGEPLDRLVATQAISNAEAPEQIIQILRQGEVAQRLQNEQGHAAMLNYCQRMVAQARVLAQGLGQTSPQMEI